MRTTSRRFGLKWLLQKIIIHVAEFSISATGPTVRYLLMTITWALIRLLGETMWNRPVLCALTVRHYTNLQSAETGTRKKTKSARSRP
ncbi:hypothetical protein QR685DRAFT_112142 [Neurospora intermedia]|uniref:Uncharacterized protein n=1 Tax=Neurospora intermedia TaxID=5142 RepID=A0ABR3D2A8_NEUIN